MNDKIYRVRIRTTGSKQPSGTYWQQSVVYCGPSLRDARIAYLREEPSDFSGGYGNRARETVIEQLDAEPDDIADTDADGIE